jgi:hypothetical protein
VRRLGAPNEGTDNTDRQSRWTSHLPNLLFTACCIPHSVSRHSACRSTACQYQMIFATSETAPSFFFSHHTHVGATLQVVSVSIRKEQINWGRLLWTFPLHQIIGTFGVLLLARALIYEIVSPQTAQQVLTQTPYFPVPVALAFISGFFWQRRLGHQAMQWVWVLPALILFYMIDQTSPSLSVGLARRLGAPCPFPVDLQCAGLRGAEALFCTAVSYSLGAFLSRTERHIKSDTVPQADTGENA